MYLCSRKTESSAVGSALRSGRTGRAFESPLSDMIGNHFGCRFLYIVMNVLLRVYWKSDSRSDNTFCLINNESWNISMAVLHKEQSVLERLQDGCASCTKGP